jgi:signal transduction histidine kinase/HD-GYP domain-containing protein (c-di-GMP phosphodiesterase class II)
MTEFVHILISDDPTKVAYLLAAIVLNALIMFALWRGRGGVSRDVVTPLYIAVPAFMLSRLVLLGTNSLPGYGDTTILLFSASSLLGYGCLVAALTRLAAAGTDRVRRPVPSFRRVTVEAVCVGVLALAAYVARSFRELGGVTLIGAVAVGLIGAGARLIVFAFQGVRSALGGHRSGARIALAFLSISWALVAALPIFPETIAHGALYAARMLDIATFSVLLGGLMSHHVLMASAFRVAANAAHQETDAAKAELAKVSSLATNLYEDSSEVIKKQKEQTLLYMKKADSLERILQIGVNIQKRQQLDDVLGMIVEAIRDNLGFKTVVLRLFNKKAQNFETHAHVGLKDDVKDSILNYRIPLAEYQKMIDPRCRLSKSYFIRKDNPWYGEDLVADRSVLVNDSWREIDMLIVPLVNEDQATIGYLSVENPENPALSIGDIIETLENVVTLAVMAIRNARFVKELEAKNEKLSIYAEKLASLNKLKANFVQTISHELRTPLTSIKAYCETLLKNAETVERRLLKEFLCVIDEESSRLMTFIEDILDFSQMESGAARFERTPCSVNKLVDLASKELKKNFDSRQITLHQELPQRDVTVNGNGEMIKQLVVNLLHNASKFAKDNGNVWLSVKESPGVVRIVVEDDGIGIPEDQLVKIFEQFYQVDSSSTRKYGGSGLGLAMCKSIVEWHDGRIWVESKPSRGARFVAVLPNKEVVVKPHVLGTSSAVRRFEIERFLELLVENVAQFLNVGKASIMLLDSAQQELRIECAIGMDEEIVANARVKLGEGIAGRVALEGKTMLVANIEADERFTRSNNDPMYRSKSFLSVPIWHHGRVIGVVNAASPLEKNEVDESDARLLEVLVERFSTALDRITRFADASTRFEQTREAFKAILDGRRYMDTKNYEGLETAALRVAEKLSLNEEARRRLHYLLNVYDLGLSRVGYHIIKNPKVLSPKDREEIHRHTVVGQEMMSWLGEHPEIANIVLCHHENYDGSGYPGQLKGDAIPIEARIIRVVDSLRALMSSRPYQRQYSLEEAEEVLKQRSGSYFDPRIVDAFVDVMNDMHVETAQREARVSRKAPVREHSLTVDTQGDGHHAEG